MCDLFKFDFFNVRGDFFGGFMVGIVVLFLVLVFGVQMEFGVIFGLYGVIVIVIFVVFFGGIFIQVSGFMVLMMVVLVVVIVSCIMELGVSFVQEVLLLIIVIFFLVGVLEVFFGVVWLGCFICYILYLVVLGFMSGIGVIIIIIQFFFLLGYSFIQDQVLIEQCFLYVEEVILEKIL